MTGVSLCLSNQLSNQLAKAVTMLKSAYDAAHVCMTCQWVLKPIVCCTDSLDGSSNEQELRQYDKWSAEEEHIFFLKLSTVCNLSLLEGFKSIAHHLPNKNRDQVIGTASLYMQAALLLKAKKSLQPSKVAAFSEFLANCR